MPGKLVDPATGRGPGLTLSSFPHLSFVSISDIAPYWSRVEESAELSRLHNMLASWNTPTPRFLSLEILPTPRSGKARRRYTKEEYLTFIADVGTTVEKACTSG